MTCQLHVQKRRYHQGPAPAQKPVLLCKEQRDFVSQQWSGKAAGCDGDETTSSLDAFLQQTAENTFTVSGMVFQDAYNIDLDRLRRRYICVVDADKGIPIRPISKIKATLYRTPTRKSLPELCVWGC